MTKPRRDRDPDSTLGLLVGAATGIALTAAILSNEKIDAWIDERSPVPEWSGVVFAAVLIGLASIWSIRRRDRLALAVTISIIPMAVGANAVRLLDPNPAWAEMMLMIAVLLGVGLMFARRLRELERLLFTEATSVAFFVTVITTGAYGILEGFFDAPRLSVIWVPIFGVGSWVVASVLFERRYS